MSKAPPDTNRKEEILSYSLMWNPKAGFGIVTVKPQGLPPIKLRVKSTAELASFATILRTEKPVFVRPAHTDNRTGRQIDMIIYTGDEPVGEDDNT